MKTLAGGIWSATKFCLLASAALVITWALGHDGRPASAVDTEILASTSASSPDRESAVVLFPGGASRDLNIWAKDVPYPGLGGFDVHFQYDNSAVSVTSLAATVSYLPDGESWIESTDRQATCPPPWEGEVPAPYVRPIPGDPDGLWEGLVGCSTALPPPPWGPQGSGILATLTLQPGPAPAVSNLKLSYGSVLIDTGVGSTFPAEIPATVRDLEVIVARCADFNGDNTVRSIDIQYVVDMYRTSDPAADLDENGIILSNDIFIAVMQYRFNCPP